MYLYVYIVIIFMQTSLIYALLLKSFITFNCKYDAVVWYKWIYKIGDTQSISSNILPDICMTLWNMSSLK